MVENIDAYFLRTFPSTTFCDLYVDCMEYISVEV